VRSAAAFLIFLLLPSPTFAERIFTGFAGAAPSSTSGILDLAQAVGSKKLVWGVAVGRVGEILGWEVDLAASPGFFSRERGPELVSGSQASTFMFNGVFTAPRGWTGSTVRPYGVVGAGLIKARVDDVFGLFATNTLLAGLDAGGGVLVLPWPRFGVRGDVRYFRSVRKDDPEATLGFGPAFLDLWRVTAGGVIRF
jgi:hypothetical protein